MDAAGWDATAATNTDLLLALEDQGNEQAWAGLCARFGPVLISFARRLGLSEPDAQDAAQESLFAFACAYRRGGYDRTRGRLRAWLFTITSNKVRDLQRKLCRQPARAARNEAPANLDDLADESLQQHPWRIHWQRAILDACLEEVSRKVEPSTLQAFRLLVLEELSVEEVEARLGMTRNAIFKAQRRVLARLRETYDRITQDD